MQVKSARQLHTRSPRAGRIFGNWFLLFNFCGMDHRISALRTTFQISVKILTNIYGHLATLQVVSTYVAANQLRARLILTYPCDRMSPFRATHFSAPYFGLMVRVARYVWMYVMLKWGPTLAMTPVRTVPVSGDGYVVYTFEFFHGYCQF